MNAFTRNVTGSRASFISRAIKAMAIALVLLIWVSVVGGLVLARGSDQTTESLTTVVEALAGESVDVTNTYLGQGEAAGRMAAIALTESEGDITSRLVESTLQNIVAAHSSVDGAFIGMSNGDFYYVTKSVVASDDGLRSKRIEHSEFGERSVIEHQLTASLTVVEMVELEGDTYDPRTRPWYSAAMENGTGWTQPYAFASSQQTGVTHFQAITNSDGVLLGIVGIDIRLAELTRFLSERVPSEHGEAVIFDDDGSIIAGLPGSSMGSEGRRSLAQQVRAQSDVSVEVIEVQVAGERQIAALSRVGADGRWVLAISSPDRDFLLGTGLLGERLRLVLPLAGVAFSAFVIALAVVTRRRISRLQSNAITDPLTGLLNRSELRRRLADLLEDGTEGRIAVVAFDLDDFGSFNDELGHDVGDTVLVGLAQRLRDAVEGVGYVGRMGGDEFMAVLTLTPHDEPFGMVERLVSSVTGAELVVADSHLDLAMSAGIAVREPRQRVGLETILRQADLALLTAKTNKPAIVLFAKEMAFPSLRDAKRSRQLRSAIRNGDIEFHFQPEVELASGRIVGAEALMRLRSIEGDVLAAELFVADMERLGLIDLVADQLTRSCSELASRIDDPNFTLRVNLAGAQLRNRGTLDLIEEACRRSRVRWCIEITERALVETTAASRARLEGLVEAGLELALDDFGTGYSSLGELANLPITTIKIDGSFVRGLTKPSAPSSLASVIVDIAERLSLNVIAEGIELPEQQEALQLIGCTYGQGFLFGEALSADEFVLNYSLLQEPIALPK